MCDCSLVHLEPSLPRTNLKTALKNRDPTASLDNNPRRQSWTLHLHEHAHNNGMTKTAPIPKKGVLLGGVLKRTTWAKQSISKGPMGRGLEGSEHCRGRFEVLTLHLLSVFLGKIARSCIWLAKSAPKGDFTGVFTGVFKNIYIPSFKIQSVPKCW